MSFLLQILGKIEGLFKAGISLTPFPVIQRQTWSILFADTVIILVCRFLSTD